MELKSKLVKILSNRIIQHILLWAAFLSIPLLIPSKKPDPPFIDYIYPLVFIGMTILPVYVHFYIFERFLSRKRFIAYAVLLVTTIIVTVILYRGIIVPVFNKQGSLSSLILVISFMIILTTALKTIKAGFRQRLLFQEIKSKQLQTELDLLKTQINPHFLFNTLNNLFGMAQMQKPAAAEGIARLSHLMRYMIYDSNVDLIGLEKEIEQINRLIELQKLRFSEEDDITIDFKTKGDIGRVRIPPMLLIPFVENSFKHGISLEKPSFIYIDLSVESNNLEFSVRNSIHSVKEVKEEIESGIGLRNIRRRLELLFSETHDLIIHNSDKEFEVRLNLIL